MPPRAVLGLLLIALLVALLLGGCTGTRAGASLGTPRSGGRLFVEISPIGTVELLRMNVPAFVDMVEIDTEGHPISDTLHVWVQHCAPKCVVPAEVQSDADLIISCYPNGAPLWVRLQHVLPAATGEVWLYNMGSYLYVSPGREPLYDVLFRTRVRPPVVRL